MGGIPSKVKTPFKNYNIVERAEKVLSKEKPTPAPSYPSTAQQIKIAKKANPNFMETQSKQDTQLHERLKQVFVTSNVKITEPEGKSEKILPTNTTGSPEWDYGFWQPDRARPGYVLLQDALKFMGAHVTDSKTNSVEKIAEQYKLHKNDVEKILEYYRVFEIIMPPKENSQIVVKPPTIKQLIEDYKIK